MSASLLSVLFAATLLASLLVKSWLATRQMRHVAGHRNAVPADFAGKISLAAHQKAADYTLAKSRLGLLNAAFAAALLVAWTFLGGLDALNVAVRDALQPRWGDMAYQVGLVIAFSLIGAVLELPLDWYSTFRVEERFGFNRVTWKLYVSDLFKNAVVGLVIGVPILALILWLMGAAGTLWWLWAWFAWMGFVLLIQVLYPLVFAPLFNKFEPLADETLVARIGSLMNKCGFALKGLFVMDGSKRSAHANAYFTGFGASKRVVFFDTLLKQLSPAELEAVLAHELGHFKHKHVQKGMALMFGLSLFAFALLGWLSTQSWFYTAFGVRPSLNAPNDALALILFMMVVPVFGFFVAPLFTRLSRKHEFEADGYACAHASGQELAAALLKLHQDNASTLTPDPLYVRFYYSHPPAGERLAALRLSPGSQAG